MNDKHREHLSDNLVFSEAVVLTGAGTETTGSTAERAVFEVLSNPAIYKTLSTELREAFPDPESMNFASLEKLPYLTGVVKEGMRLVLAMYSQAHRRSPCLPFLSPP